METSQLDVIKLGIVDDHTLFREGLMKLINLANKERNTNYKVLFDAAGANDMMKRLDKRNPPDIALMDIGMEDGDGFEAVLWLNEYCPKVKVLVVSMIFTEEAMIRMLRLGVKGYLTKHIESKDIYAAIDAISKGGYYYTDYITGHLLDIFQHEGQKVNGRPALLLNESAGIFLTEKERIFLKWVCSELTYMEISEKMNMSHKTADDYREKLFKKLGVKSRVTLALFAVKHGLVTI
jgi:DNA-binding NarL/FixJ family response regulator